MMYFFFSIYTAEMKSLSVHFAFDDSFEAMGWDGCVNGHRLPKRLSTEIHEAFAVLRINLPRTSGVNSDSRLIFAILLSMWCEGNETSSNVL